MAYSTIGTGLVIPANTTRYLDLYLVDVFKLVLLLHVMYSGFAGTGVTVKLFDGVGPRAAAIPFPYAQSVPNVFGDGSTTTEATFEALGVAEAMSTVNVTTFDQSASIAVDRKKGTAYLRVALTNTDATHPATVDVFGTVG